MQHLAHQASLAGHRGGQPLVASIGPAVAPEAVTGAIHGIHDRRRDVRLPDFEQRREGGGLALQFHADLGHVLFPRQRAVVHHPVRAHTAAPPQVGGPDLRAASHPTRHHEPVGQRGRRPGDQVVVEAHTPAVSRQAFEDRRRAELHARGHEALDAVRVGAATGGDAGPDNRRDHRLDGVQLGARAAIQDGGQVGHLARREHGIHQAPAEPVDAHQHHAGAGGRGRCDDENGSEDDACPAGHAGR